MNNELISKFGGLFAASLFAKNQDEEGEIVQRTSQINGQDYVYQLYLPEGIESKRNLPIIVFLHGIRERGSGGIIPDQGVMNAIIRQYFKQIPAIILFPQCRPGKYWSDEAMENMVLQAIAQTSEEFDADEKRLYLVGVSMGGYGVWNFAMHRQGEFAALVSICGGSSILSGDRFAPLAKNVGKTPTWLFHGSEDRIVPVSESREIVEAIKSNQGNVKYNEYEGVGHNVWMNVLGEKELMKWLLAQHLD